MGGNGVFSCTMKNIIGSLLLGLLVISGGMLYGVEGDTKGYEDLGYVEWAALRYDYVQEVEALEKEIPDLRAAGMNDESIAKLLHEKRRDIGKKFKEKTKPSLREKIFERNVTKYGDKWGPTIEYLRGQGKSWDEIIESSYHPEGTDIIENRVSYGLGWLLSWFR